MRTALGQFSFALVILKIFTQEFYAMGALFAVYGTAVLLVAVHRRYRGNRQFFTASPETDRTEEEEGNTHSGRVLRMRVQNKFKTSGDTVLLLTGLSLGAYISLM
ncbi:hypothetical protein E4U54_006873, partial [Claviceps lovelessii]